MDWDSPPATYSAAAAAYPTVLTRLDRTGGARRAGLAVADAAVGRLRHPASSVRDATGGGGGSGRPRFGAPDLMAVVGWKRARAQPRPRLVALAASNSDAAVATAAAAAFAALDSDAALARDGGGGGGVAGSGRAGGLPPSRVLRAAVDALCVLTGVGPATASAVLAAVFPAIPFMSDEAAAVAPATRTRPPAYTTARYLVLAAALGEKADELNAAAGAAGTGGAAGGWTAQTVEQALWAAAHAAEVGVTLRGKAKEGAAFASTPSTAAPAAATGVSRRRSAPTGASGATNAAVAGGKRRLPAAAAAAADPAALSSPPPAKRRQATAATVVTITAPDPAQLRRSTRRRVT
ncbi:hypothetical protein MMPV_003699 [Pyropia vietnamensis]